jgi:Lon protease-like protein
MQHLPLFLLQTVLFPEDRLPLRVFEARYMDMVSRCLKVDKPFGVCLIQAGQEVGEPADPVSVGTLAFIKQWEMPQPGVLHILAVGGARFEIERLHHDAKLAYADVRLWDPEPGLEVPPEFLDLAQFLRQIISDYGSALIPPPHRFDDASWVGMRLAHLLPVANTVKQGWLEERRPGARLAAIKDILKKIAIQAKDES